MSFENGELTRRHLLGGAALLGLATAGLAACGPGSSSSSSSPSQQAALLPSYRKLDLALTPDIAGTELVQEVFFTYPGEPVTAVPEALAATGADLRAIVMIYDPPPTPLAQNDYWALMNSTLGVNYVPDLVPAADFLQKFSTVVGGGGSLPDMISAPTWVGLPRMKELVANSFLDLGEHLSGDAVLDYPNLANIPTVSWQYGVTGGQLWGVPVPRTVFPNVLIYRDDLSTAAGFEAAPRSQEEFLEWCTALTDSGRGRYALSSVNGDWFGQTTGGMYELPNAWQLEGGALTHVFEFEGWLEAMEFSKKLWDSGYVHPDSPTLQIAEQKTLQAAGTIVAAEDGLGSFGTASQYPDAMFTGRAPHTMEGSSVHANRGLGFFSFTAFRHDLEAGKVEEYLQILNYLASPFGSTEYTQIAFGIEGSQHTMDGTNPIPIEDRRADIAINLKYLACPPNALYGPDDVMKGTYTRLNALEAEMADHLVEDPTAGLTSDTFASAGQTEFMAILDARNDFVLGRASLDDVRAAIKADGTLPAIKEEYLAGIDARGV